jgi:phosphoglycolate phosphatase-like HAD superfamily hydrolase
MKHRAVIFDVDGTLANIEHRRHWVQSKPKNWPAFNAAMKKDGIHQDVAYVFDIFKEAGHTMLIASGRGEEDREVTELWLFEAGLVYEKLYMRPAKDYRPDNIIKMEILDQMRQDGYNPHFVFDDRNQVVDAWRQAGLRCFQVAPGNF